MASVNITDMTLLRQWMENGDPEAFTEIVHRHSALVYGTCKRILGNASDAEEVAQECFLKLTRAHTPVRTSLPGWLHTLATHCSINRIRSDASRRKREVRYVTEASDNGLKVGAANAEWNEMVAFIDEAIAALPEKLRFAVVSHFIEGQTHEAIAEMLGVSRPTITRRIQKGVQQARKSLVRRGVSIGASALGVLMTSNMAEAAPASLTGSLAKLAVGGPGAAAAGGTGGHIFAGAKGLSGVLSMKGGLIVALLAVTAVAGIWVAANRQNNAPVETETPELNSVSANSSESTAQLAPAAQAEAAGIKAGPETSIQEMEKGEGIIWGEVVGLDGKPAAGVKVIASSSFNELLSLTGTFKAARRKTTTSGANGRFRFEGLPLKKRIWVLASVPGESSATGSDYLQETFPENRIWLELEPAAILAGQVVDENGKGIPQAFIHPQIPDDRSDDYHSRAIRMCLVTDDTGKFSFDYLWPGEWDFVVQAAGHASHLTASVPAGTTDALFKLSSGGTASGKAVDMNTGSGLGSVKLGVYSRKPFLERREILTDEQGLFRILNLRAGTYGIGPKGEYINPGEAMSFNVSEGEETEDILVSVVKGGMILGRVYSEDTNAGIPGILIFAEQEQGRDVAAFTDEAGHYLLEGLREGTHTVFGPNPDAGDRKQVAVKLGQLVDGIDFPVNNNDKGTRITGRVVDAGQSPMAGVKISASSRTAKELAATRSSNDGTFELAGLVPTDDLRITGRKAGWISEDYLPSQTKDGIEGITIVMRRPATIAGKVVNKYGQPIAGLNLWPELKSGSVYTSPASVTTQGGRFAFARLVPGSYALTVFDSTDFSKLELARVEVAASEDLSGLEFILEQDKKATLTIEGRVIDSEGRPIRNARISTRGPKGQSFANLRSDDNGLYSINALDEALYIVRATHTDYAEGELSDVAAGSQNADIILKKNGSIDGQVINGNTGLSMTGFHVVVLDGARDSIEKTDRERGVSVPDAAGKFLFTPVAPGENTVAAWADGFATAFEVVDVPAGKQVSGIELRLVPAQPKDERKKEPPATCTIEGIVIDESGRRVADAIVLAGRVPHPSYRISKAAARADSNGEFKAEGVPAKTRRVFASHPDYGIGRVGVALTPDIVNRIEIQLERCGAVSGTLSKGGRPLENVWMFAGYWILGDRFHGSAYTDANGRYKFAVISPGEGTVKANIRYSATRYRTFEQAMVVEAGKTTIVDFDILDGDAGIEGTIFVDGRPADASLHITIATPGGEIEESELQATEEGKYLLSGLPVAELTLKAIATDGKKSFEASVTLETISGQVILQDIHLSEEK